LMWPRSLSGRIDVGMAVGEARHANRSQLQRDFVRAPESLSYLAEGIGHESNSLWFQDGAP
jgi:hypothetical protein